MAKERELAERGKNKAYDSDSASDDGT